jgi:endonuclease I
MYSTATYYPGQKQCGNYKVIGDCYNKEHSFPKSWFNDESPMYSDAFHVYPTDGKVNGQRSNNPYGECANGTVLPANGSARSLGKSGACTFEGYTGIVFEPDDEYKGDFARSYFYMAACYNSKISSWSSPMLAGNNYPCFKTWAVNLLLKWHRQDPVSPKELARNEVVYGAQGNRNPFIDHPELAEHIWGDKQDVSWSSAENAEPQINMPINGSTFNVGVTAIDIARSATIKVKGLALSSPLTISVSGVGFSTSMTTLSAASVNTEGGVEVPIVFKSSNVGTYTGQLILSSSEVTTTVQLMATVVDGIPAGPAEAVTATSFVATWLNISGDNTNVKYRLTVREGGTLLDEFPMDVAASEQRYEVTDLSPETEYTYTVTSGDLSSEEVHVTTGAIIPMIQFLYEDDELDFTTAPDTPSDIAEVLIDTENINTDITLTVGAPFELSTDKSDWAQSIVLSVDEDRFYLRMGAVAAGAYSATLDASAGSYYYDGVDVVGHAVAQTAFVEDFEATPSSEMNSYDAPSGSTTKFYDGTACRWEFYNAGIFTATSGETHAGKYSARFGKTSQSYISMAEDKRGGAGVVTFYARSWSSSDTNTISIEYSTNGGVDWMEAKSITLESSGYNQYSADVYQAGSVRIRFRQTAGARLNIDDIAIEDFAIGAVTTPEYHTWDAFCRNHQLVIEADQPGKSAIVYGVDGIVYANGLLTETVSVIDVPAGLYLVAIDDFVRRVVVK